QDALRHQQTLIALQPKETAARQALHQYRLSYVGLLVDAGDHAAAAQAVTATGDDPGSSPARREEYRIAGPLARWAARAQKDEKLPQAKREELARTYGDQVLVLLRRAVAAGFNDVSYLKTTADFDALRTRKDFRQLLDELQTR